MNQIKSILAMSMLFYSMSVLSNPLPRVEAVYSDWDLMCNQLATCHAVGYQRDEGDHSPASILISREAGARKRVIIKYALAAEYGADLDENKSVNIHLYLNGQDFGQVNQDTDDAEISGYLTRLQADALLKLVAKQVKIEFKNKYYTWTVSDAGMTAALLKMDDVQKRVGTVAALVKKGSANESQVLSAAKRPIVKRVTTAEKPYLSLDSKASAYQALRAKLIQGLDKSGDDNCYLLREQSTSENNEMNYPVIDLYRLSSGKVLASSLCWRGAYNEGYGAWVIDQSLKGAATLITESATDFESGEILSAHKGRGLGDCWGGERWTWNGNRYIQTSRWETGRCKGFLGGIWHLDRLDYEIK